MTLQRQQGQNWNETVKWEWDEMECIEIGMK